MMNTQFFAAVVQRIRFDVHGPQKVGMFFSEDVNEVSQVPYLVTSDFGSNRAQVFSSFQQH